MLVPVVGLEWGTEPIFRRDNDNQITLRSGSRFGLNPYMNLQSRYYPDQARFNLSWVPAVPKYPSQTLQESQTEGISDELLRQFARGSAVYNKALSFFKTANQ